LLRFWRTALILTLMYSLPGCGGGGGGGGVGDPGGAVTVGDFVVLGYNDLGMHCMNQDFSEIMILPPFNNLHAQVIDRTGENPRIVTSGITVQYEIPGNTTSSDKTNFWTFSQALLGMSPPPDVGLTGNGLAGTMTPTGANDWIASGIPITPTIDAGTENAYQLATITVTSGASTVATTRAVVPVSWEISCDLCHSAPGISVATDILRKHDFLHGTNLQSQKPVACGKCHEQPPLAPLGLTGQAGVPTLSSAMHSSHASRMGAAGLSVPCYACHPGVRTRCLRDVHLSAGKNCMFCHGDMAAVGSPARRPWVDEPRCADCHARAGFQFEQAGTLYRDSKGHHRVHCEACHGSPHAILPSVVAADNVQSTALMGRAGTINKCGVCHRRTPDEGFNHSLSGGG
jgi:hypothetical protein